MQEDLDMMPKAVMDILDRHHVMALATVCPDGWPQATTVNFVAVGMTLYALISRVSEKYTNLQRDDRVSIAIGSEASIPASIEGLSIRARARELRDEPLRSSMAERLSRRNPGYFVTEELDWTRSALIRCNPSVISVIDYSKGLGHLETFTIGAADLVEMTAERIDDWGPAPREATTPAITSSTPA